LVNVQPLIESNRGSEDPNAGVVIPYSYLNPLPWEDWAWDKLAVLGSRAGIAVCQLHGLGKPNLAAPSYRDYQGLVLRAQRDGAIVKRQVFWEDSSATINIADSTRGPSEAIAPPSIGGVEKSEVNPDNTFTSMNGLQTLGYPWRLFSDDANP
jgi:hypothetical protein